MSSHKAISQNRQFFLLLPIIQGIVGIISQLIILRELPQIFYGNELSFGFILTAWLFWTAFGSGVVGKYAYRIKHKARGLALLSICACSLTVGLIVSIRYMRVIFDITPGEIVPLLFIFVASIIAVLPLALIHGIHFTLLAACLEEYLAYAKTNQIYILESSGALIGCLLAYMLAFPLLDSFQTVFILYAVQLFSIALFLFKHQRTHDRLLAVILMGFTIGTVCLAPSQHLNQILYKKAYHPLHVLHASESRYGSIVVTQQADDSLSIFENGMYLFTTDDSLYTEESTAFALLAHPHPRRILLLGGGLSGALGAISAHPSVESITYVEFDPALIQTVWPHLDPDQREKLSDPAITVVYQDARAFLREDTSEYDIILSLLPSPQTLQMNRFFTLEFFRLARSRLSTNGVFSFSVASSDTFINTRQAVVLKSLHMTLRRAFPFVEIMPGNTNVFLAFQTEHPRLTSALFIDRIRARGLSLNYINEYFLPERLSQDNIGYLQRRLSETREAAVNKDLDPFLYYDSFLLWTRIAAKDLTGAFARIQQISPFYMYVFLVLFGYISLVVSARCKTLRYPLALTITSVGLCEISLEIIILLLAQVYLGNIYSFIALIIGGYMAGLMSGSFLSHRHIQGHASHTAVLMTMLKRLQLGMVIAPLTVLALAAFLKTYRIPRSLEMISFFAIMVGIGFVGGMQFPIVNTLFLASVKKTDAHLGSIYALDLFGSAIGACLISLALIPLVGILHTLLFLCGLNALCYCVLHRAERNT